MMRINGLQIFNDTYKELVNNEPHEHVRITDIINYAKTLRIIALQISHSLSSKTSFSHLSHGFTLDYIFVILQILLIYVHLPSTLH